MLTYTRFLSEDRSGCLVEYPSLDILQLVYVLGIYKTCLTEINSICVYYFSIFSSHFVYLSEQLCNFVTIPCKVSTPQWQCPQSCAHNRLGGTLLWHMRGKAPELSDILCRGMLDWIQQWEMYLYQLQKRAKGMLAIVGTLPILDRLNKTNLLGHVRHHQVRAIGHWSNHLGMCSLLILQQSSQQKNLVDMSSSWGFHYFGYHLAAPALLGERSESCVDQQLPPLWVMPQHSGQHLHMVSSAQGYHLYKICILKCSSLRPFPIFF